jgi:NAD+ kinase
MCQFSADQFDLVLTLGGDGTVLYTSWLFQNMVPPVIPFHLGSLGFLSSFDFAEYRETLNNSFRDGVKVNLRMRLTCTVFRYNQTNLKSSKSNGVLNESAESKSSSNLLQVPSNKSSRKSKKKGHKINHSRILLQEFEDQEDDDAESAVNLPDSSLFTKGESFEVLNELVVDRGPSPFMSLIELYVNGEMLTTIQADGLTVATPTGSTAYSLSAGGSLVHPEIPALLITPNCPHTLSFRPMLLPDTSVLHLCVPFSARGTAWASFDGRGSIELKRGDYIRIQTSSSPFPTVCKGSSPGSEWFNSLNRCLNWNQRALQKSFNSEESSNDELDTESDYSTSNE